MLTTPLPWSLRYTKPRASSDKIVQYTEFLSPLATESNKFFCRRWQYTKGYMQTARPPLPLQLHLVPAPSNPVPKRSPPHNPTQAPQHLQLPLLTTWNSSEIRQPPGRLNYQNSSYSDIVIIGFFIGLICSEALKLLAWPLHLYKSSAFYELGSMVLVTG